MSINRHRPHLFVLPEDDANRQIADGFVLEPAVNLSRVQILPNACGWARVRDSFEQEHNREMMRYLQRYMVALVDFDGDPARLGDVKSVVAPSVAERVFVLGCFQEPERLRTTLGDYETIGKALAKDCADGTSTTWEHQLLAHNAGEVERLIRSVRPFLFR